MKIHIIVAASLLAIGSPDRSVPAPAPTDVYGSCEDKYRWDLIRKKHRFNESEQMVSDAIVESNPDDGDTPGDAFSSSYPRAATRTFTLSAAEPRIMPGIHSTAALRDDDEHEELPEEDDSEDSWTPQGNFMCHDLTAFPFSYEAHCSEHGVIGGSCATHEPYNSNQELAKGMSAPRSRESWGVAAAVLRELHRRVVSSH